METLLEIRDLSVTFQDEEQTRAARHVSLELKRGELAALVGESGSGKNRAVQNHFTTSRK